MYEIDLGIEDATMASQGKQIKMDFKQHILMQGHVLYA